MVVEKLNEIPKREAKKIVTKLEINNSESADTNPATAYPDNNTASRCLSRFDTSYRIAQAMIKEINMMIATDENPKKTELQSERNIEIIDSFVKYPKLNSS